MRDRETETETETEVKRERGRDRDRDRDRDRVLLVFSLFKASLLKIVYKERKRNVIEIKKNGEGNTDYERNREQGDFLTIQRSCSYDKVKYKEKIHTKIYSEML